MSFSANALSTASDEIKRIVIVIYPGVTLLDAAGPAQVFSSANSALATCGQLPSYDVVLVSPLGGEIASDSGISLGTVSLNDASAAPIDTLIVAGGNGIFDVLQQESLVEWIAVQDQKCRRLASTCMGAFLIAEAGLLEDQAVTTHWRHAERLQNCYPDVRVECDALFIKNGRMWSSAGVTAGIDLALAMVEEDHGHDTAMQVAQSLVVYFKRPGGQSQFSDVLIAQKDDGGGTFSELHAWIASNLHGDLSVESLAHRAGMSTRTFARLYKECTGITPAKSVEMLRVDNAKRLLEQGAGGLARIALRSGLADEQRLRRAFLRHVGISPTEYRTKFSVNAAP
jgi:transcriptional regulator GlxA family with amidase domain